MGVVLVEQFAFRALRQADPVAVLDRQRIVMSGTAVEIAARSDLRTAADFDVPTNLEHTT